MNILFHIDDTEYKNLKRTIDEYRKMGRLDDLFKQPFARLAYDLVNQYENGGTDGDTRVSTTSKVDSNIS